MQRAVYLLKTLHNDFVQRNHDRTFLDSPSFYNNYSLKNIASAVVTINCHYPSRKGAISK